MTHRDASPTSCPGDNLVNAIQELLRIPAPEDLWNITRYYTPVHGQERYYRTISDKDFIHKTLEYGLVEKLSGNEFWYSFASGPIPIGHSLEEADAWFKDRPEQRDGIRKELEYMADFKVNCSGDCLVTADGYQLKPEDAFKVAACPPEMPFGTRLQIDGIGKVVCRDRGSAIKNRKIDVWAGIGDQGLQNIRTTKGGQLPVTVLK